MFELPYFLHTYIHDQFEQLSQKSPQARQRLQQAVAQLSQNYLQAKPQAQSHLQGELAILAYLNTRLPATYAASADVMAQLQRIAPAWQPEHMVDLGAGLGSVSLAALQHYQPQQHLLFESEVRMIQQGREIFEAGGYHGQWQQGYLPQLPPTKHLNGPGLWSLGYVLNELTANQRETLYARLQAQLTSEDVLTIIEPGTPVGYAHILEARDAFLNTSENPWIVWGPCPHQNDCPLPEGDWCHFAERLPRSPLHRDLKGGERNFEDEKYSYLILSQQPAPQPMTARLLRHPRQHKGHMQLRLCTETGIQDTVLSKKNPCYKALKKANWGDGLDAKTTGSVLS